MATSAADRQVSLWAWIGLVLSFCFFSGITGDVPDGVVYTDLHKTVQLGDRVILKCEFLGNPLAVYWKKGNDPTIKQSLMSWFGDEPLAGTCTKDRTCDMGDDFSLIIKNISIADQNRYICRVASYKGILIYNFTDVKVFALPREPYPVISECLENHGKNCTLLSTNSVNITCTVMRYFPNIDLFFLHGVQKYATSETLEWRNSDGTKNKAISTKAQPSEIPYVCVAFNIPGSRDQKTATVSVINHQDVPTGKNEKPHKKNATKIVLPMLVSIAFGVVVAVVIYLVLRKKHRIPSGNRRKGGDDRESQPMIQQTQQMDVKGHLSYYELWMFVSHANAGGDHMKKLRDTFNKLQITSILSACTPQEAYQALCDWKDKQEGNHLDTLKKALKKADYIGAWKYLRELREKKGSNNISPDTLGHIIWQTGNTNQVKRFLGELIPNREGTNNIPDTGKIREVVEDATTVLKNWSSRSLDVNQIILLSIALERAECTSLSKTFFTVTSTLLSAIQPEEVATFTKELTSRHCKRLAATLKISKEQMDNIIEENTFLFDTRLMATEGLRDMECSNYEKRCRLDDAIIKIGRYDLEDFWGTVSYRRSAGAFRERLHVQSDKFDHESIYDDDIPQLVTLIEHLPPDKKKEIYTKIGYDTNGEDAVEDRNRVEVKLKEWRKNIVANSSKEEALKQFHSLRKDTIKGTKYDEMTLTDGEIEIVAAHVKTAKNQQTVKEKLEIEASVQPDYTFADQLKNWRNTHKKTNCRDTLREALACIRLTECIVKKNPMKCVYDEELAQVAFDLLMEDVRPIIYAFGIDQARVRRYIRPTSKLENKGTIGLMDELMKSKLLGTGRDRNDFCKLALRNNGFVDVGRSVYFDYVPSLSELINIISLIEDDKILCFLGRIGLNQNDIAECQNKEGKTDMPELMRLWKHRIRPVPYHYRLELASALEASGMNGIAGDVLSGRLQTRAPHESVLRNICRRLDDKMLAKLSNVLEIKENRNRSTITPGVIKWVEWWMENFDPKAAGPLSSHMSDRKKMNDCLFHHGFVELAQEITALEHCHPLF